MRIVGIQDKEDKSCVHPFWLIDVNLHLVDGEDAHPLESHSEGGSPHSVTLAGVQGGVQQLYAAVLGEEHDYLCLWGQQWC